MALKNIEVFIDATPEGERRADYAATLAHQCGAHLAGIHVVEQAADFRDGLLRLIEYGGVLEDLARSTVAGLEFLQYVVQPADG